MTRYLTRDSAALTAAVLGPLALAAVLLPWRGSWPNTGRFMLTPKPGSIPSRRARLVAVTLAGLIGHAISASSAPAA